MNRIAGAVAAIGVSLAALTVSGAEDEISGRHFPDRMHAFIWRNWECVGLERMAKVLGTDAAEIEKIGLSMGLPPHVAPAEEYNSRGYITIIRRNWHLVSRSQLRSLLGWSEDKLQFTLRDDDFLGSKLGPTAARSVRYVAPSEESRKRCAEIKAVVEKHFGGELAKPGTPRFQFVRDLQTPASGKFVPQKGDGQLRFIYSYMSLFGDPLSDAAFDPFPEGILRKYAEQGINGVWLHVTLWDLAPSEVFPEAGKGWEKRLANLSNMVKRADQYGIKIFLYMNEPRTSPTAAGNPLKIIRTRCTSDPNVKKWLRDSLTHVFKSVPGLGGIFTITASENPTNCWCYGAWGSVPACPACKELGAVKVLSELSNTMAEGVHAGNPDAKVIVWDWGWADAWTNDIIAGLPKNAYFMSVSEWGLPVQRGDITANVGEYSISAVGPGPRARQRWAAAKAAGLKTAAKVQLNCTWEMSNVPYVPAMRLIAEHCRNLNRENVDCIMMSWSLGGYPSPNLRLASIFREDPKLSVDDALAKLAVERYGSGADDGLAAWKKFSDGYAKFPYGLGLYFAPTQLGPSNLLYPVNTRQGATMVCYCFDDIAKWLGLYSAKELVRQFDAVVKSWKEGIPLLESALAKETDPERKKNIAEDLGIANAVYAHFQSVRNQVKFTYNRNKIVKVDDPELQKSLRDEALACAADEIEQAKLLYRLTKQDSRIGYEASNHYDYLPLDLVEKVVNCEYIIAHPELLSGDAAKK